MAEIYANELWRVINNQVVNGFTENDLESFREPRNSFNSRVTTWGAYDKTYMYYKNSYTYTCILICMNIL